MVSRGRIVFIGVALIIIGLLGALMTFNKGGHQMTIEKNIDKAGITTIDMEADHGSIIVLPSVDNQITVELSAKDPENLLTIDTVDSTLFIKVMNERTKWFNFGFQDEATLKVYVPEGNYEQLLTNIDNGSIEAADVQATSLQFNSDNGRINLQSIHGETIHVNSENGRIELSEITATKTHVKSDNGKIDLIDVNSQIHGYSNNGKITLTTDHLDRTVDLEVNNGKITVTTDEEPTNATLDLRTANGKINVFGSSDWETVIGSGDHLIKLVTNNGSIKITK